METIALLLNHRYWNPKTQRMRMLGAARFCEIDKHWMKNQEVESREWTREYIK